MNICPTRGRYNSHDPMLHHNIIKVHFLFFVDLIQRSLAAVTILFSGWWANLLEMFSRYSLSPEDESWWFCWLLDLQSNTKITANIPHSRIIRYCSDSRQIIIKLTDSVSAPQRMIPLPVLWWPSQEKNCTDFLKITIPSLYLPCI